VETLFWSILATSNRTDVPFPDIRTERRGPHKTSLVRHCVRKCILKFLRVVQVHALLSVTELVLNKVSENWSTLYPKKSKITFYGESVNKYDVTYGILIEWQCTEWNRLPV
jgi:hypothetical protein